MIKSVSRLGVVAVAAASLTLGSVVGWAQPAAPAAPEDTRALLQRMENERVEREAKDQKRASQRREEARQRSRKYLRDDLGRAGFGDRALQSAILDFIEEQDLAREEVRAAAAACYRALEDQQMDDPEIQALLDAHHAASARAQTKREAALAQLDAQIHFSTNPRLKTFLTLRGLAGNEGFLTAEALPEYAGFTHRYELQQLFSTPPKPVPAPLAAPAQ